jgi:hypothetical protein
LKGKALKGLNPATLSTLELKKTGYLRSTICTGPTCVAPLEGQSLLAYFPCKEIDEPGYLFNLVRGHVTSPALESAIFDAVVMAEKIMQKIDSRSEQSVDDFKRELSMEESNVTVENSFSTG